MGADSGFFCALISGCTFSPLSLMYVFFVSNGALNAGGKDRWCRGSVTEKLFAPLVDKITVGS